MTIFDQASFFLSDNFELTEEQADEVLEKISPQLCCNQEPCMEILREAIREEAAKILI